jgi:hypothetical protein
MKDARAPFGPGRDKEMVEAPRILALHIGKRHARKGAGELCAEHG